MNDKRVAMILSDEETNFKEYIFAPNKNFQPFNDFQRNIVGFFKKGSNYSITSKPPNHLFYYKVKYSINVRNYYHRYFFNENKQYE